MDRETIGTSCLIVAIILGIVGGALVVHFNFIGRPSAVYDIWRAEEWLWKARASTDLNTIADYIDKALVEIDNRRGNPSWWFPTVSSDFDIIKNVLKENRDSARQVALTEQKGSYGYQRAIDNVQEAIIEVNEHLDSAMPWLTDLTPFNMFLIVFWAIAMIVLVALFFLLG